jgi:L-threonylcarbamoyladenylate synthase
MSDDGTRRVWSLALDGPDPDVIALAVDWLRRGRLVAFPTDTFYGLAVDPASDEAVARLFRWKGRSPRAALPLVASSAAQVEAWGGPMSADTRALARRHWPGPLSLVIDAPAAVVTAVHGGLATVAIRVPAHGVARALAEAWGAPVTATSANRSGAPPAVTAGDLADAGPELLVLDAGPAAGGAPSTIVDARSRPVRLVREGATPWERVLESLHG